MCPARHGAIIANKKVTILTQIFIKFFINSNPNLTRTKIQTPKPNPTPTQTLILIFEKVITKCAEKYS